VSCDDACKANGGQCERIEFKAEWEKLSQEEVADGFTGLYREEYADAIEKTTLTELPYDNTFKKLGTSPYRDEPQSRLIDTCFLRNTSWSVAPYMEVKIETRASKVVGSIKNRYCFDGRRKRTIWEDDYGEKKKFGASEFYYYYADGGTTPSKHKTWNDDFWGEFQNFDCYAVAKQDTLRRLCFCSKEAEGRKASDLYKEITRDASREEESINKVNQVYNSAWEQYRAAILESGKTGSKNALVDLAQKKAVWAMLDACIKTQWSGEVELTGALREVNSIVNKTEGSVLVPDDKLHKFIVDSATSVVPWHNEDIMKIIAFNPLRDETVEKCAVDCDGFGPKYLPQCERGRYKKTAEGCICNLHAHCVVNTKAVAELDEKMAVTGYFKPLLLDKLFDMKCQLHDTNSTECSVDPMCIWYDSESCAEDATCSYYNSSLVQARDDHTNLVCVNHDGLSRPKAAGPMPVTKSTHSYSAFTKPEYQSEICVASIKKGDECTLHPAGCTSADKVCTEIPEGTTCMDLECQKCEDSSCKADRTWQRKSEASFGVPGLENHLVGNFDAVASSSDTWLALTANDNGDHGGGHGSSIPMCSQYMSQHCCPAMDTNTRLSSTLGLPVTKAFSLSHRQSKLRFDDCSASCVQSIERVLCAAMCDPRQADFVKFEAEDYAHGKGAKLRLSNKLCSAVFQACQDAKDPSTGHIFRFTFKAQAQADITDKMSYSYFMSQAVELYFVHPYSQTGTATKLDVECVSEEDNEEVAEGMLTKHDLMEVQPSVPFTQFCTTAHRHSVDASIYLAALICLVIAMHFANIVHQHHVSFIPESGIFIFIGIVFALMLFIAVGGSQAPSYLDFSAESITLILLPPIIFDSGYSLKGKVALFERHLFSIITFAIVGTLISTFTIGGLLYAISVASDPAWFPKMTQIEALLFGSLISAVDPVATLCTFAQLKVDPKLETVVFGESLVNDAMSIVLFRTFKAALEEHETDATAITHTCMKEFALTAFGSTFIGLATGLAITVYFRMVRFKHNESMEALMLIFWSYCSFLIAEGGLGVHLSGILAALVCGVVCACLSDRNVSDKGAKQTQILSRQLAEIAEMTLFVVSGMMSVLFVIGGYEPMQNREGFGIVNYSWPFYFATIFLCLLGRGLSVFSLAAALNTFYRAVGHDKKGTAKYLDVPGSNHHDLTLDLPHQIMMWAAGLRGAIAIGLAMDLPTPHRYAMLTTTCMVVLTTTVLFGSTTPKLLQLLKIPTGVETKQLPKAPPPRGWKRMILREERLQDDEHDGHAGSRFDKRQVHPNILAKMQRKASHLKSEIKKRHNAPSSLDAALADTQAGSLSVQVCTAC
jgi:sodium/hydrogen exchanger 3